MKLSLHFCLLYLFVGSVRARPRYEPRSITHDPDEVEEDSGKPRSLYTGNMTIGFMPLISVIASMIPRIMSRFAPPVATTTVRSSDLPLIEIYNNPCIDSKIGRWPFPNNSCQFYQCTLIFPTPQQCVQKISVDRRSEKELEQSTIGRQMMSVLVNDCVRLTVFTCAPGFVFDPFERACTRLGSLDTNCPFLP